ncbi:MAG: ISAzo13 family transposase [Actinobacteria bacterium]|nr:ISAzo13 family transposase [Actinomycetota bacterium]
MIDEVAIGERYRALAGEFDERRRRLWAAAEARSHGRGGIAAVARATGIAENTVRGGLRELESGETLERGRVRRRGGGRRPLSASDPTLVKDLERLTDGDSRGDPQLPLRWTAKSVRRLADGLRELGHQISHETVARLLRGLGYSLQANAKVREGRQHPDRDAQFEHINDTVKAAISEDQPVISVDTKRRSSSAISRTVLESWRRRDRRSPCGCTTSRDPELGKAIPYGIYDLDDDSGWVNVGIDHDTAQFAVASIRGWWQHLGADRYRDATTLTIRGCQVSCVGAWCSV